MTYERDLRPLLDEWFADGPDRAPDRVLDVVIDRLDRQRQRPAWRLAWRPIPMNPTLKFAAAIAAVVLVAVIGYNLLPTTSSVGVPVATPSPSPDMSPSPSADGSATAYECGYGDLGATGCAGPLLVGEHQSAQFRPTLAYQTPDGWTNRVDIPAWFELSDADQTMIVWSEVVAAYQSTDCTVVQKVGFGGSVQDWIDYLTSHPGLVTSDPVPVTLGDAVGQSIDISVAPDWNMVCKDNPAGSGPNVVLFIQAPGAAQEVEYGVLAPDRMHLTFVDVAGQTVVIAAYAPGTDAGFASAVVDAKSVIDTMRFTPSN